MPIACTATLVCHPEGSSEAVYGIEARLCWTDDGALAVTYTLKGDMTRLRIPPRRQPRRADGLWQRTCFEAFVSMKGQPAYHEFNFAPSCEWAVYAFQDYREHGPLVEADLAPRIAVRRGDNGLELDAVVGVDRLPGLQTRGRLGIALSAVIEDERGMLSYWALRHPKSSPDFHHPDAFALELEFTEAASSIKRKMDRT